MPVTIGIHSFSLIIWFCGLSGLVALKLKSGWEIANSIRSDT